ncbi:hypothetical protein INS49_012108 [Diaporthe citri]|uniref:uncharacterized protein n=1 Tax=Diaporthe citri TaxID=83186 RepID=UPI001C7F257A|nr:uncharacterized protein INS49_012108 [Diaporthe citri]KAG6358590.1 hypothetical protein INS49_012108 [Diaporthe citri]
MAPSLEATSTTTALEARETRFYYNNGDCGDKNIYVCRPGIIYGIVGAVVIGLAVIFYALYLYRDTRNGAKALVKTLIKGLKTITPCLRRRRKTRRVRRVKRDVEMNVVDFDAKTVGSDTPKEPADTGDSQTASASNSRHVHFSGP